MYKEIIIFFITVIVIYLIYFNDTRISWEAYNGKTYKIRNDGNKLNNIKADFLAKLDEKARNLVKYMYENKLPSQDVSKRTYNRFKNCSIGETPNGDKSAAYTINKGNGGIYICCLTDGKLNSENDSFFVILHELAHVMSNSYGHGDEFKENFDYIVKLAVKLDYWKDPKYEEKPVNYCGVKVTSSPCSGDLCNNQELDSYFKQTLLD